MEKRPVDSSRHNLGHLAVAFIRASLEDVMYLTFFVGLDQTDSQELFKIMGNWDSLRQVAMPLLEEAGISGDGTLTFEEIQPVIDRLLRLGKVPLVHSHEWNLTPEGPLDLGSEP
jgi:hypothetical protein